MRLLIVVALLLGVAGLALGVVSIIKEDEKGSELALTLTVQEGDFKVNDVAPPAKSEEDISSGDSFVFTGVVSGDREGKLLGACEVADAGEPTCQVTYSSMTETSLAPASLTSASRRSRSRSR